MKQDRKLIWDYLKSIGVELTIKQHNELRDLITKHDENAEQLRLKEVTELKAALAKAKQTMAFLWKKANRKTSSTI